jgi:hypothetical protein
LGSGRNFRRWGLVGKSKSLEVCLSRAYLVAGTFISPFPICHEVSLFLLPQTPHLASLAAMELLAMSEISENMSQNLSFFKLFLSGIYQSKEKFD